MSRHRPRCPPERALIFTEPVEVGRLSLYAERVRERSFYIRVAGLAILAALHGHRSLTADANAAA